MNKILTITTLITSSLLVGCAATGVYQLPLAPQNNNYSRELNADTPTLLAAITNVIGPELTFDIKNHVRDNIGTYINCGEFISAQNAPNNVMPDPKSVINYMSSNILDVYLTGYAGVIPRPLPDGKTMVQISGHYTVKISDKFETIGLWHFTSHDPDTQKVYVGDKSINVTCQSSHKLENELLTKIAAQVPVGETSTPEPVKTLPATRLKKSVHK